MDPKRPCAMVGAVCVLALVSGAAASMINYGDFPGGPGQIDFLQVVEAETTGDPLPMSGPPARVGEWLEFDPDVDNYRAAAAGGATDMTSGTLHMTIEAPAGESLGVLAIEESGAYSFEGTGDENTYVSVSGMLTVLDISPVDPNPVPWTAGLVVDGPPPYSMDEGGVGVFSACAEIDLTGLGVTKVLLNYNNTLTAVSQAASTAVIYKDALIVTPEPATLTLLAFGALAALRRRRR